MKRDTFFKAIREDDEDLLLELLEADPEIIHARTDDGGTGMHVAVAANQKVMARILVYHKIDLNVRNSEGRMAVHDAFETGHWDIADYLLDKDAEVDICMAAGLGEVGIIADLLKDEPELVNDRTTKLSPLGWAAFGNEPGAAALLIERGARMDDGELLCAAAVGHVKVGTVLLAHGADPNALWPETGLNAFHVAAEIRHGTDTTEFIRLLVRKGGRASLPTADGRTALEIALACAETYKPHDSAKPKRYDNVIKILKSVGR